MGSSSTATGSHFCEKEQRICENLIVLGQFFQRKHILLSLLSPVLSLNILLQLQDNLAFTNFSDSSDSKNKENFSYVYNVNGGSCLGVD